MKKVLCLFLICLTILLIGCGKKIVKNEEEMLEIFKEELTRVIHVEIIGTIELDDVILVCYMMGNDQGHTYRYAEFIKNENSYEFVRSYLTLNRGIDVCSAIYNDSYLFISNNYKNKSLRLRFKDGKEELIKIDKVPFIYFMEDAIFKNFSGYDFLDINGEEINP